MDRTELLNDPVETMQIVLDGRQSTIWTAMPGIIQSVNFPQMTCEVQIAIQGQITDAEGNVQSVSISKLVDVPLVFPSGGGFIVTFPLVVGDEVLLVMASRCVDAWWQNGGYLNKPMEARMHDLSDAFAIPGPKSVPKTVGMTNINPTKMQIRRMDGHAVFSIGTNKFAMQNTAADLRHLLNKLNNALISFMETLAGFSGGGSPVTQAMLQVPATAAGVDLADVATEISDLLEDLD